MKKGLNTGIKVLLLHPQQRISSLQYWQANEIKEKVYFLKKIYKSLWDSKALITFAPRKTTKVPWQIDKKRRRNEIEIISKKNFKFFLPVNKESFTFAPACRDNDLSCLYKEKQEEHVPRHIELTAVTLPSVTQE